MLSLSSVQDVFYLVGAVSLVWVSIFLCWSLFQIGRLFRQANEVMSETREKVGRFERAVITIGEKVGNVSQYLGFIAEGGKQLLNFLHTREEKKEKRSRKKGKEEGELSEMP